MYMKMLFFWLLSSSLFAHSQWVTDWPDTDFSQTNIDITEIISGGPPKDGIPAIDNPIFSTINTVTNIENNEPVMSITLQGVTKAYPIRIMMYHEIVNDVIGDVPIAVTYCPLCNSGIVFNRKVGDVLLDFGTTGKLRHSDMVMYDRQTESWWQQFTGKGIVGTYTDTKLTMLPSRMESFGELKKRHPQALVLIPNNPKLRNYGSNPYVAYDSSTQPFLLRSQYTGDIPALARVVAIDNHAYPLSLLKQHGKIEHNGYVISWVEGQASALDNTRIANGRDVGNVVVTKNNKDVAYHIPFAFAFVVFTPEGIIHTRL